MKIMELPNFFIGTDIVEVDRINKLLQDLVNCLKTRFSPL